ncbi:putative glutathione S-transferase GSTU6 [Carex rostrata]|jgi:glutathione S-transferase
MAEGDLKLLGAWPSPFVIRVRMILEQKGLDYEYLEEDLFNKSELLLKHNPIHKKVPVFIHDNRSICESLVILQYIDEKWSGTGPPVLPADPYERAIARFWAAYIDDKLFPSFLGIVKATTKETKAEKITDTLVALEHLEEAFKKCSAGTGKRFFGGDSIGFVDVTLGSHLTWIKAAENMSGTKLVDETKVPLLVEWQKRFLDVDFVKFVLPSAERVEEYGRMLQAKFNIASVN